MLWKEKYPRYGFTILELLLVLILICVLALMALAHYVGCAQKSRVAEAINMMRSIILSEKMERHRDPVNGFYSAKYEPPVDTFREKGVDLSEALYFTYRAVAIGGDSAAGFKVTATATTRFRNENPSQCAISYTYRLYPIPEGRWSCDGVCITHDMLPGPVDSYTGF